ncbi:MAG: fumarylacetoacetate hydrolase family protein [Gemmatimonadaceae bacterium]|nr:fumarylacetoacetate hydrolase family protein [Chitinophagaceae bacterium]
MHLYKTTEGIILKNETASWLVNEDWDLLVNQPALHQYLLQMLSQTTNLSAEESDLLLSQNLLPPIGSQEVWAAGVTYLKSRDARMEESKDSGGADCYQKVYDAERPEIFFKSMAHRVAGHNETVHIRRDSDWNVPEPELALFINNQGNIAGYSIGNDMSSRSIEGENPLYLPQAKTYQRSAAIGPCLFVPSGPVPPATLISMQILRSGRTMYTGETEISRMKRTHIELAEYLFREMDFNTGAYLMTGTCLVPPNDFSLQVSDEVLISIQGIGIMKNIVKTKP